MLSFIVWSLDPQIFTLGPLELRYYGILFFLGFFFGYEILVRIFKIEKRDPADIDTLTVYMLIATVLGARLGHCLFYEPDYFLKHPLEILFIWKGGLASHGAAVGILFALFLYARQKKDQSYLYILDRIVITIALAAFFIRTGNWMNSEIVGKPTDSPSGVVFAYHAKNNIYESFKESNIVKDISIKSLGRDTIIGNQQYQLLKYSITLGSYNPNLESEIVSNIKTVLDKDDERSFNDKGDLVDAMDHVFTLDKYAPVVSKNKKNLTQVEFVCAGIPRHPSQLYEAFSSLILFVLLIWVYSKFKANTPEGLLFSIFVIWIFGLRFVYEFLKENQVAFEDKMPINMGQILSIPLILVGIFLLGKIVMSGKLKQSV